MERWNTTESFAKNHGRFAHLAELMVRGRVTHATYDVWIEGIWKSGSTAVELALSRPDAERLRDALIKILADAESNQ